MISSRVSFNFVGLLKTIIILKAIILNTIIVGQIKRETRGGFEVEAAGQKISSSSAAASSAVPVFASSVAPSSVSFFFFFLRKSCFSLGAGIFFVAIFPSTTVLLARATASFLINSLVKGGRDEGADEPSLGGDVGGDEASLLVEVDELEVEEDFGLADGYLSLSLDDRSLSLSLAPLDFISGLPSSP